MASEALIKKMTDVMAAFVAYTAKKLPDDVMAKLEELRKQETSPMAKVIYDTMFENQDLAMKLDRPSCQDTGVLQFWVKCGTGFPLIDDLTALLKEAVVQATFAAPLRHNSVESLTNTIPVKMSAKARLRFSGTLCLIPISVRYIRIWPAAVAPCRGTQKCLCPAKGMKAWSALSWM